MERRIRAFCGVFRTDGVLTDRERLVAMARAAPIPAPDPVRTWTDQGLGLAWSGGPAEPAVDGDAVLVGDIVLYERATLCEALDVPTSARCELDDAQLVLRAWSRWGTAFVERLVGDFAFALVDRRRCRLLLARGPFGACPLSVHRRDGLVVFGTWMHSVLAQPDVPRRINEARVADFFLDALEAIDATSTFYEAIQRHPPAHVLVADANAQRVEPYPWLRPERVDVPVTYDDQVAGLRDVLGEAVAARLEAHPGAGVMLSGGIDSISVACLARAHRASTQGDVPTYTGVLADADADTEGPYARAVVAGGGLTPTWIRPEEVGSYASAIRGVIDVTEDLFDVSMLELRTVLYAEAARQGTPALLDGVDGNLVASHDAEALGYLARSGRWGAAWRAAGGLGRFYGTSRHQLLWTYGVRALRPEWAARWKRRLLPSDPHGALVQASLVSPSLAQRVGLAERVRRRVEGDPSSAALIRRDPHAYHRKNLSSPLIPAALERYARAAAYQGLRAAHPLLDPRVASYTLALPFETKVHGGTPKGALRQALEGLAPSEALWRPAAHNLSTDFWRATLGATEDLLGDLEERRFSGIGEFADMGETNKALVRWRREGCVISGARVLRVAVLASWLHRGA